MAFLFELLILVKGCVICIIVENTLCSDFTVTVINVHILFTVLYFFFSTFFRVTPTQCAILMKTQGRCTTGTV